MIEKTIGIITESLELVVANPVPAKFIAFAYIKNERTNNNPNPQPKTRVSIEKDFDSVKSKIVRAITEATR